MLYLFYLSSVVIPRTANVQCPCTASAMFININKKFKLYMATNCNWPLLHAYVFVSHVHVQSYDPIKQ